MSAMRKDLLYKQRCTSAYQKTLCLGALNADVIAQPRTADSSFRGQGRRGRSRGGKIAQDAPPTNRGVNNRINRAKKEKKVDLGNDIPNNQEPAERKSLAA